MLEITHTQTIIKKSLTLIHQSGRLNGVQEVTQIIPGSSPWLLQKILANLPFLFLPFCSFFLQRIVSWPFFVFGSIFVLFSLILSLSSSLFFNLKPMFPAPFFFSQTTFFFFLKKKTKNPIIWEFFFLGITTAFFFFLSKSPLFSHVETLWKAPFSSFPILSLFSMPFHYFHNFWCNSIELPLEFSRL